MIQITILRDISQRYLTIKIIILSLNPQVQEIVEETFHIKTTRLRRESDVVVKVCHNVIIALVTLQRLD
jgi:hypothetical protein